MNRILIAISDSFPYGAAYAARTRALCKLFNASGYKTDVLCDYISEGSETDEYGNIYCVSASPCDGLRKLILLPSDYANKLESLLKENEYDFIVSRSMFDRFDKVLAVAKKYNIPIILESCEWYDVRGFRRGKLDIRYHQFQHCFKNSYNKVDGVIAISRLLENHYKSKNIPTVRIPGIHDVTKLPYSTKVTNENETNFIFGGNVFGGKEQFSELLIALKLVKADLRCVHLHIYGPSKNEVLASLDESAKRALFELGEIVIFHGRVKQNELAIACMNSDFGVFFRPDRRSSHAGFPTKLGEYLAAGTPLITNDTGDISLFIENGSNGFIVDDVSVKSICDILDKCITMNATERERMRNNARETAVHFLDYPTYVCDIKKYFESMKIG